MTQVPNQTPVQRKIKTSKRKMKIQALNKLILVIKRLDKKV